MKRELFEPELRLLESYDLSPKAKVLVQEYWEKNPAFPPQKSLKLFDFWSWFWLSCLTLALVLAFFGEKYSVMIPILISVLVFPLVLRALYMGIIKYNNLNTDLLHGYESPFNRTCLELIYKQHWIKKAFFVFWILGCSYGILLAIPNLAGVAIICIFIVCFASVGLKLVVLRKQIHEFFDERLGNS